MLARRYASELGRGVSEPALERLKRYDWPGNVRELKHAVARAAGSSPTLLLGKDDFDFIPISLPEEISAPQKNQSPIKLKDMERRLLVHALRVNRGNRALAAKDLGIARSTVFEMIRRHGIRSVDQFTMNMVK